MKQKRLFTVLVFVAAAGGAAQGQTVNGGFETGAFPPWIVAGTPSGGTLFQSAVTYDIDGPGGPRPPSRAAQFMVGQTTPGTGLQGVEVLQTVTLEAGRAYRASFDWSVWALVNVNSRSGGHFEFMIDGAPVAQVIAPVTQQGVSYYGRVESVQAALRGGAQSVGVRIRRDIVRGEEVFQYLDNIELVPACPADWNNDGVVDFNDFLGFLNDYNAGLPRADLNGDGVVDFNDLLAFLNLFNAPC